MLELPDRRDERWNDAAWRTAMYNQAREEAGLTHKQVAELLDRSPGQCRHYAIGTHKPIGRLALRLFIFEVLYGGK